MLKLRLRNQCHFEVARVLPIVCTQWKCIAEGVLGVLECESMMRQSQSATEAMEVLHKISTRAGCWTQGMSMGVAHARNLWELQKKSNNDSNENYQVPVLPFDSISGSSAHRNLTQSPNGFWNVQSIVDIKIIWLQQYRQNILETALKSEAVIRGHQYAVVRPPVTMRKFYCLEISHHALGSNSQ